MARANRHHIPGQVWHITHRCHKRAYLLKFARDRERWLRRLFEAKKRFGLIVLGYTVNSNHIPLGAGSRRGRHCDHRDWVDDAINGATGLRQPEWPEALAVGSEGFVTGVLAQLGALIIVPATWAGSAA